MQIRKNGYVDKEFIPSALTHPKGLFRAEWVGLPNGNVATVEQFYAPYDYKKNGELSKNAKAYSVLICRCANEQIAKMITDEHNSSLKG